VDSGLERNGIGLCMILEWKLGAGGVRSSVRDEMDEAASCTMCLREDQRN
jgi:hypothetical protein